MSAVHVCLVSDNLLPNLIPILMDRPQRVCLIASEDMIRKGLAQRFQALLNDHGIASTLYENAPATGLAALVGYAAGVAEELRSAHPGQAIVLNATGGTKLMALAFVEAFRTLAGVDIIYTNTSQRVVESLTNRAHVTRPMPGVLDVPTYLASYGLSWRRAASADPAWRAQAAQRRELSRWLAHQAGELQGFLGALNALARQALDEQGQVLVQAAQRFGSAPRGRWRRALERIAAAGLLDWRGGAAIRFRHAEAARYLHGLWLEEYAWQAVSDEAPHDVQAGVEGAWEGDRRNPSRNEFDLLVVHADRMLVVECKTGRFGRDAGRDQDILYKLDSLGRSTGGLFGRRLLLSARSLPEHVVVRAKSHGIEVLDADRLADLRDFVRRWMSA